MPKIRVSIDLQGRWSVDRRKNAAIAVPAELHLHITTPAALAFFSADAAGTCFRINISFSNKLVYYLHYGREQIVFDTACFASCGVRESIPDRAENSFAVPTVIQE